MPLTSACVKSRLTPKMCINDIYPPSTDSFHPFIKFPLVHKITTLLNCHSYLLKLLYILHPLINKIESQIFLLSCMYQILPRNKRKPNR
jgi:hypothetical protein